jgi:membrane protease YdiL (CAAX protease family)
MEATGSGSWQRPQGPSQPENRQPAQPGSPARFPARFKVWDAVVVFLVGELFGATVGFSIGYAISGDEIGHPGALTLALGFVGQYATFGLVTWWFCRRRATGSLRTDLGLQAHWGDWWVVPLGMLCAVALGLLVLPLRHFIDDTQSVVNDLNDSSGAKLAVIALAAGVFAPIFEELLFRGLLLRSLLPLVSEPWAIGISAVAFGGVHFIGGSVLGTLAVFPALVALGVISGIFAVRSGDLSKSILLHVGFNLLAVIGAVLN